MRFPGVGSARTAQLALAVLMCAFLAACGGSSNPMGAAASAVSTNSSTSSVGIAGATSATSTPTEKAITLSWTQPTQNSNGTSLTDLAGYTLHYGTSSQDYTGSIQITSATQTSYVVSDSNFPPGKYYFTISAYNAQQVSSSFSGEVAVNID